MRFTVTPLDTFTQPIDMAARVGKFPPTAMVKGLFFARLAAIVGEGSYVAWRDYPQAEYARLTGLAGAKAHPTQPPAEQLRRVARDDFATFAKEPVGAMALSFVRSPATLFQQLPRLYKLVLKGGNVAVRKKDDACVEVEFTDFFGQLDCYMIGQMEGMVRHYGVHPTIDAELKKYEHAVFTIRWSDTPPPGPGKTLDVQI